MDNSTITAELIQQHMRKIRRDLRADVHEVVTGANQLLDWKSYVRRQPWLVLGGAAALGYLMVPQRSKELAAVAAAQESLNNLAEEVKAHNNAKPTHATKKGETSLAWRVAEFAAPIIGGLVMRAGTVYGAKMMDQVLNSLNQPPRQPDANERERENKHGPIVAGPTANGSAKSFNGTGKVQK